MRLLLRHAANEDALEAEFGKVRVNARDRAGRTPLHAAAAAGDPEIIDMLVTAGAETQAMDANLETAIDVSGSAAAHVKLAAVAGVYNARERHETAVLRVRNARALAPGGIYDLYRGARVAPRPVAHPSPADARRRGAGATRSATSSRRSATSRGARRRPRRAT